jgi:hypothetical protein
MQVHNGEAASAGVQAFQHAALALSRFEGQIDLCFWCCFDPCTGNSKAALDPGTSSHSLAGFLIHGEPNWELLQFSVRPWSASSLGLLLRPSRS